jgi:hypothetical protein
VIAGTRPELDLTFSFNVIIGIGIYHLITSYVYTGSFCMSQLPAIDLLAYCLEIFPVTK